jgi:hypothetical protein
MESKRSASTTGQPHNIVARTATNLFMSGLAATFVVSLAGAPMKDRIRQSLKQLRPNNAQQRERNIELARVEAAQNVVSSVCRSNLFTCHACGHRRFRG